MSKELSEIIVNERKVVLTLLTDPSKDILSQDEFKKLKDIPMERIGEEEVKTSGGLLNIVKNTFEKSETDKFEGTPIQCYNDVTGGYLYLNPNFILFHSPKLQIKIPISGKTSIDDITKSKWFTSQDDSIDILLKNNDIEKIYTFWKFTDFNSNYNTIQTYLEKNSSKKFDHGMKITKLSEQSYPVSQSLIRKFNLTGNNVIHSNYFCKDDETSISGTLYLFKDRIIFDPSNSFGDVHMNLSFKNFSSIEKPSEKDEKLKLKIKDELDKTRTFSDLRQRDLVFTDLCKLIEKSGVEIFIDEESATKKVSE